MTDEKLVYESLDAESNQVLQQYFDISFRKAYVKCKGHVVPEYFQHLGDKIRQMDVRDDDIWMCTYPRTGQYYYRYYFHTYIYKLTRITYFFF